jgi:hypothetical protein
VSPHEATQCQVKIISLMRALRSSIYSYLLDSKYTRLSRCIDDEAENTELFGSGVIAYKFHTNILAVNHAIRSEAEELLYKRNTFIVASNQWPGLNKALGGLAWVPMVSKKHVNRMYRHSARIHIGQSPAALAVFARHTGNKAPVNAFIMLGDDMEAFCLSAHYSVAHIVGPILQVTQISPSGNELQVDEEHMGIKPSHLKCELRDTEYRLMDASTRRRLLAPFVSVIGASQRLIFTGRICDETQIAHLRRIMSPSTSCLVARWYHLMEYFSQAKEIADNALRMTTLASCLAFISESQILWWALWRRAGSAAGSCTIVLRRSSTC